MREIKFRAWDGEKMHYSYLVARPQFAECLSIMTDEKFAKKSYGLKEWKVMQYTGINGNNGKEIYEGDIILAYKPAANYPLNYIIVFNEKELGFRMRWDGHYKKKEYNTGFYDDKILEDRYKRLEIIGNIYENPELLK